MTVFDQVFGAIQFHEVGADPTDPANWTGNAVGVGTFRCFRDGLSIEASDPGNWTGGAVGHGTLAGTRWGIDSASYVDDLQHLPADVRPQMPALVRDLTLAQASTLTDYAYWQRICGDRLSPRLALLVTDAAFNNGVPSAARWLQEIVGANEDGVIGDQTIRLVAARAETSGISEIAASFHARRITAMASMASWKINCGGWSHRLAWLPFQAAKLASAPA